MDLITPGFGLLFWMLIGFGILYFILRKFAWPVIVKAINSREQRIEEQLNAAAKAREEMKALKSEHEALLQKAKEERDVILSEARKLSEKMYDDAKEKASREAQNLINEAKQTIHFEKMKALTDIKNEIAQMSIEIAEKILSEELSDKNKQEALVAKWMKDVSIN
ncbi:MAG: F0F1 ATP synthase subunit B [Bacteroidales bacterium]|nr:F0F1 ATP synthase subunit B [Bacteroidales bacterium]